MQRPHMRAPLLKGPHGVGPRVDAHRLLEDAGALGATSYGMLGMPGEMLSGGAQDYSGMPGGEEASVSSTHMALNAWVEAKRTRNFDEADRIREAMLASGVDPSKILPKWGRWSSRERQLREIAENKRVH